MLKTTMRPLLLALALLLPLAATAQQQQRYIYYHFTNGTGFMVDSAGHLITNNHVVRDCKSISILTPAGEKSATLVANHPKHDLALLKMDSLGPYSVAPFRKNMPTLVPGATANLLGYPGNEGAQGRYSFKKATVVSLAHTGNWVDSANQGLDVMTLTSTASKGNSGGPVLDGAGNVIGVITGMAVPYSMNRDGTVNQRVAGQTDIAVTLRALRNFLAANRITPTDAESLTTLGDGTVRNRALKFTFPVRCVVSVETR